MTLELIVRGALAGEAMAATRAEYRVRLLPPKRLARLETLARFAREHEQTNQPRPYAHSSPPQLLQPGAGECVEWLVFSARLAQRAHDDGDHAGIHEDWARLARTGEGAARLGTRHALENLRRGLNPPQSGHDNPHYFDDLAMVRALAAAAVARDPEEAVQLAHEDAVVTHDLDGLWCAAATAALFHGLISGASTRGAVDGALHQLPEDSWSRRLAIAALEVANEEASVLDRSERLSRLGDWTYAYPFAAPETLAFLLAHLVSAGSADELLLGAFTTGRGASALPVVAGAAAAAVFGTAWMPRQLTLDDTKLTGISVPELAGISIAAAIAEGA